MVYVLNPQEEAAKYATHMVIVMGTLTEAAQMVTSTGRISGSTILASSISVVQSPSK